jgi:hypothetical protein
MIEGTPSRQSLGHIMPRERFLLSFDLKQKSDASLENAMT